MNIAIVKKMLKTTFLATKILKYFTRYNYYKPHPPYLLYLKSQQQLKFRGIFDCKAFDL